MDNWVWKQRMLGNASPLTSREICEVAEDYCYRKEWTIKEVQKINISGYWLVSWKKTFSCHKEQIPHYYKGNWRVYCNMTDDDFFIELSE